MRLINDAIQECLSLSPCREVESLPLLEACGASLAADLVAERSLPLWDQSAMDGYAVRAEEPTQGAVLSLGEIIPAGHWPQRSLKEGEAARIFTGAPLPEGSDAVVIQENVVPHSLSADQRVAMIKVESTAQRGDHIRVCGEELRAGTLISRSERTVTPGLLGLCASQGWTHLPVFKKPNVALLETGTELVEPGIPLSNAQIYASNATTLSPLIKLSGGQLLSSERVSDHVSEVVNKLNLLIDQGARLLITTGGVSVGDFDPIHQALEQLGATRSFWRVKMKPGKPISVATLDRGDDDPVLIIGLPGNPVSCVIGYLLFVHPLLQHLSGVPSQRLGLPRISCILDHDIEKRGHRAELFRVSLLPHREATQDARRIETWRCGLTGGQSSAWISSISQGDGLLYTSAPPASLKAGDRVEVALFPWSHILPNAHLFDE